MIRWLAIPALAISTLASAAPPWFEARSGHFTVIAQGSAEEVDHTARELEQFDSVIRYFHGKTDTPESRANPVTVYVVPSIAEVVKFCTSCPKSVAGFYQGRASGSVAFTPRRAGNGAKTELGPRTVLFHEYAHHFLLGNSALAYPPWLSEGYAEFVATMVKRGDGFQVGAPPLYRAWGLMDGVGLSAEQLFDPGENRVLDETKLDALYGRGWLLTHYLMFDPARRAQLSDYLIKLNSGTPSLDAAKAVFGDLGALDRALTAYFKRSTMSAQIIPASRIAEPQVTVRQMSAGEGAMMPLRWESEVGVTDDTAPSLYRRAVQLAAPYSNDAQVQGWLAEMALDANEPAAALAAAERALAIDPNQPQALLYQGQAKLSLVAKRTGVTAADWQAARLPIVRANRAAPNNAEPLELYYQSFGREERAPPPIAVQGLLRAVQLVPQDRSLRMLAINQMLRDRNWPTAIVLLRPVAYDPHQQSNNVAIRLLTALQAKQYDRINIILSGADAGPAIP